MISLARAHSFVSTLTALVDGVAALVVVGLIWRAGSRLLRNPEEDHADLVPAWERHVTTVIGVPVTAVALSSIADGPLHVGYVSIPVLLAGFTLLLYPEFAPRAAA